MLKDPECAERYAESLRASESNLRIESARRDPAAPVKQHWTHALLQASQEAATPAPARERMQELQAELAKYEQLDLPPKHYFAPGMYGRELFIPGGSIVVGKIHKHEHIVMLMCGTARINTDKGMETITGPKVWISPAGAKRALTTITDCTFFTCHATNETDLEVLEAELIEAEPNPFLPPAQKELP